jgi:hypothetical protein
MGGVGRTGMYICFCMLTTKEKVGVLQNIKLCLLLIFCNYSNSVGILCATCREAGERELRSRSPCRK